MRLTKLALLLGLLACATACGPRESNAPTAQTPTPQASQPPADTTSAAPKSATCALLSRADIKEVQGEEPSDAQGSEHLVGGLRMSQCFYRLPTFNKSISLEVVSTRADAQAPASVKDYWRQKFQGDAVERGAREREQREHERERRAREREEELKRENANGQVREGGHPEREREGSEETHTRRVSGVGDEAYWSGSGEGDALYVLKKGTVISVSVGGTEDESEKIRRAKALAAKVLKHF